jgi:cell wall-associated NlpC family hydrolase
MPLNSSQKEAARDSIRRYCERAEENRAQIHYDQNRPMNHLGRSPSVPFTTDCSGFVTGAFRWADLHNQFSLKDPNGLHYSGYGFTGTLLSYNRKGRVPTDHKFYVGDMAIFGPRLSDTRHVIICKRNGMWMTALWTSHGSELGPYPVYLGYRPDLLLVVRAEDLR